MQIIRRKRTAFKIIHFAWLPFIAMKLALLRQLRLADIPMMAIDEILLLSDIIRFAKPKHLLEWGAGFSTLYFSKRIDPNSHWFAIEHNKDWHDKIEIKIAKLKNVSLFLVPPDNLPWTDDHNDGSFSDLKTYVLYPRDHLKGYFDFILIDGRARNECLAIAQDLVSAKGIIALHDANRKHYTLSCPMAFPKQYWFLDYRKEVGGIFIASKQDLDKLMEGWRFLWKITARFRKAKNMIFNKYKRS